MNYDLPYPISASLPFRKWILLFLSLAILSFFLFQKVDELFFKPTRFAIPSEIFLREGKLTQIDQGRFFFSVPAFGKKPIHVSLKTKERAQYVFLRKGVDVLENPSTTRLRVSLQNGPVIELIEDERYFIPAQGKEIHLTLESLNSLPTKLVIDEIGASNHLAETKGLSKSAFFLTLLFVFLFCLLSLREAKSFGVLFFFLLSLILQLSFLELSFPSEKGKDLRAYLAAGPLQEGPGCNSNYGLHMASSVLQGKGPVIGDFPSWCRMPGYGLLLALAGNPFHLLQMALNAIFLQLLLFSSSLAFFYFASLRILPRLASVMIVSIVSLLPFHFHRVTIESVMPAVILFSLGIGCFWIEKRSQQKPIPLFLHLFLHLSFALWFILRTDVLPAWALVSLILYGKSVRTWRYFLIPSAFFLCIGLSWALFKLSLLNEFCMTTHSVGASMMIGLWEVPHKFIWTVSDGAYFHWMDEMGISAVTKEGSDYAVKEVFRFCLTYPIYTLSLIFHKMLFFLKSFGPLSSIPWKTLLLSFPLSVSLILNYKRFQTFLLAWPVFFNIPLFFVFYASGGRFYIAPVICLIIASLSLLLDAGFYRKIIASSKKTAMILLSYIAMIAFGPMLDDYLVRNEFLRYWAPFLDPKMSTLNILANSNDP
jgi:hypothetical protein